MKRSRGFTLIELMIVIGIVAILAAIAIPSYTDYVRRGRITEAVSTLAGMRVKMEQYFQDNRSYAGACQLAPPLTIANLPAATPFWTYACVVPLPNQFTMTATGAVGSTVDGIQYTFSETNARTTVIAAPSTWLNTGCGWVLKKDGSC